MKISLRKLHTNRGEASGDFILISSIVLILGILWVLSGGPEQEKDNNPNALYRYNDNVVFGIDRFFIPIKRDSVDTKQETKTETEYTQKYDSIIEELGRVRDFGETSPHWGLVTIDKSSYDPKQTTTESEYVTLNVSRNLDEPLIITGWKLQSMVSNRTVTIPEATKISTSGNVNIEQPVVVSPKDKIYVLTGHSPIGSSFQINKCSGYFEQFQDFTPSISKQCPSPEDEFEFAESDPLRFGDACLTYIEDLPRCIMPLDALPLGFSDSCVLFITEKINYSSCINNHKNDDDFFKPEWRIYLKQDSDIWGTRDIIRLLDNDGKTVDVFSY